MPGLEIIESVGVESIAAESKRRTEKMVEFAIEHGWTLNSPREWEKRGGSIMIGVENGPAMVERLAERKVFVDSRPRAGLRISPHFFNTDEEVEEAMNVLAELI
jgi:kynureninase